MASRRVLSSLLRSATRRSSSKPTIISSKTKTSYLHLPKSSYLLTQITNYATSAAAVAPSPPPPPYDTLHTKIGFHTEPSTSYYYGASSLSLFHKRPGLNLSKMGMVRPTLLTRCIATTGHSQESVSQDVSASLPDVAPRVKFKRLDKTARHIMQILDKEAVQEVKEQREIAREITDIKPGYIVQLKVEVPENKRRVSTLKGIVIARRNAGLNSTFRLRRLVAGVGVESVFPLYSPNIKELKILEKKKVRRAKLYYLRDKMNALKKQTSR